MIPFRFGPVGRRLYGVFHPGMGSRRESLSVLMCNPLGQEAIRSHRLYRVLADRLAGHGIHVMRFDYRGTGEADGDDADGDLDGWREDVVSAHAELARRAASRRMVWFGARLGATLAALAASGDGPHPDEIVMWEPVLDGGRYWDDLRRGQADDSGGIVFRTEPSSTGEANFDVFGFAVNQRLAQQLRSLNVDSLLEAQTDSLVVIAPASDASVQSFAQACSARKKTCRMVSADEALNWTSEEALNHALVPSDMVRLIDSLIDGGARA